MYSEITVDYLIEMMNKATRRRVTGSIGNVAFTGEDIIRQSLEVTNRCAEQSNVKIGGVYMGQLNLTFKPSMLNKVPRGSYRGKVITVSIGLKVGNTWEDVPLGVFTVENADICKDGIIIEAYDNMHKLDKEFDLATLYGKPYDLLSLICNECGVTLGVTQAYIESLANGTEELYLVEENDIETWRDLLYWVAQAIVQFATFDRVGELQLCGYGLGTTEFDEEHRDIDAVFSDYVTQWTSISIEDNDSGETQYYSIVPNDGLCMELGNNPLLQTIAERNMLEAIAYLEGRLIEIDNEITHEEGEKDELEADLAEVEEELREHPDDPALLAQKTRLEQAIANEDAIIAALENEYRATEQELNDLRRGVIDQSKIFKERACRAILREVAKIKFMPFTVASARDPIFELGDEVLFTGRLSGTEHGCIMAATYKVDGCAFEGYGDNPALTYSRSSTDKSVTGVKKNKDKGLNINFVKFVNAGDIIIRKNQTTDIGIVNFGVLKATEVEARIEIKLKATPSTEGDSGILLTYYLDGEEITAYHPIQEWNDKGTSATLRLVGETLHFSSAVEMRDYVHTVAHHYHLTNITETNAHTWRVTATGLNGTEIIETGDARIVLWAQGMIEEKGWIGRIDAADEIPVFEIATLELYGDYTDEAEISLQGGTGGNYIVTENGDKIVTENGDYLIT